MNVLNHLIEIRRRSLQLLIIFSGWFLLFFFFSSQVFNILMLPLLKVLPNSQSLIATQITSTVFTPIQLAIDAAFLCSAPFFLMHLWRFISPGLYSRERQHFGFTLLSSFILFLLGCLFSFYFVLPTLFQFFLKTAPVTVKVFPDMSYSADFITRMLLIFGFCFQVPLVCVVLTKINLVSVKKLREFRPYVIVGAFIIGMLLTPPDVLSQILLAVPLCLLYELGIILGRVTQSIETEI